jgi:RNA polymerase sigma factor (sigma-70 family)
MAQHDGLVQAVVRRQGLGELRFAAALQAGRTGLWRAILGYDPERGTAFSTYAWPCIMRQVWRAVQVRGRDDAQPRPSLPAAAPAVPDPAAVSEASTLAHMVVELVQQLPPQLRPVVQLRYGLADGQARSFAQIGAHLGCSGEWARQLHWAALVWLRQPAHSQHLRIWLGRHTIADYRWAATEAQRWLVQRGGRRGH